MIYLDIDFVDCLIFLISLFMIICNYFTPKSPPPPGDRAFAVSRQSRPCWLKRFSDFLSHKFGNSTICVFPEKFLYGYSSSVTYILLYSDPASGACNWLIFSLCLLTASLFFCLTVSRSSFDREDREEYFFVIDSVLFLNFFLFLCHLPTPPLSHIVSVTEKNRTIAIGNCRVDPNSAIPKPPRAKKWTKHEISKVCEKEKYGMQKIQPYRTTTPVINTFPYIFWQFKAGENWF